jgi:hypothetical protein
VLELQEVDTPVVKDDDVQEFIEAGKVTQVIDLETKTYRRARRRPLPQNGATHAEWTNHDIH